MLSDGARHEFLAGSAFTADQDRRIGRRGLGDEFAHTTERVVVPDHVDGDGRVAMRSRSTSASSSATCVVLCIDTAS